MRTHVLERETEVPRRREEVFAFFAAAGNLEALTPSWLWFEIASAPAEMGEGARIEYRLRIRGVPVRWTSEITAWEPPRRFVDVQVRGPYRLWEHEHRFEERPEGTAVIDRVRYAVPGDTVLGGLVQRLVVGPDVERIFDFRQTRLEEIFG